jgi:hypothetical protein
MTAAAAMKQQRQMARHSASCTRPEADACHTYTLPRWAIARLLSRLYSLLKQPRAARSTCACYTELY